MNRLLILAIVLFLSVSCKKEIAKKVDVSNIKVTVSVNRFEQKFYEADETTLPELKNEFPYLFPVQNDSVWLNKMKDEEERELYNKSQEVFGDFENEKKQIEDLFKHVKYYNPNFEAPKIITLITNLDYQNKIVYADSLLFVSLDMYLGKSSEVYQDFPVYLSQNFDKSQLVVDMASAISDRYFTAAKSRQFLDMVIGAGKKMHMVDSYLPSVADAQKIGYSETEYAWAKANEAQIWKYFIEDKVLYSTDSKLVDRFMAVAPFSKFYIDIDKDSPGRIGVWLGWQIVRAYMNNNEVTLQQLLQTDAEEIFKKSKYKPKK
ncbi:MAG: gliding motility lipoprotein GldB [Flavobacteria bacterium RIFCSPLOWO2_12_FULL_35_11]|nr:MAG: gliding motility lipoprotein GldB [Flavobacteria bacterium RIFCSPLOWO2_12_FULL_35_11]